MKCCKCNRNVDGDKMERFRKNNMHGELICYDCNIKELFSNLDKVLDREMSKMWEARGNRNSSFVIADKTF